MDITSALVVLASYIVIYLLCKKEKHSMLEFDALKLQVGSNVAAETEAAGFIASGSVSPVEVAELTSRLAASEAALRATFPPAPPTP